MSIGSIRYLKPFWYISTYTHTHKIHSQVLQRYISESLHRVRTAETIGYGMTPREVLCSFLCLSSWTRTASMVAGSSNLQISCLVHIRLMGLECVTVNVLVNTCLRNSAVKVMEKGVWYYSLTLVSKKLELPVWTLSCATIIPQRPCSSSRLTTQTVKNCMK
jgi:hypothetical protein